MLPASYSFTSVPAQYLTDMTFPWEVPPETVIVERVDGRWRVVPHRLRVEIFETREEAMACALAIANRFLMAWRIVERPMPHDATRSA
ncbi:MAG TPA: hypothetical protein VEL51_21550 [Vicinamibacterales bacterium]|nr:hypothetical protein [Vicinamibacterales bacterium]